MKAWSFTTLGEEAAFQGNLGYPDDLERSYVWDSDVPNYAKIAKGDLAILRDSDWVLGVARVLEIDTEQDVTKVRRRCPNPDCQRTGFKRRKTLLPEYKCPSCQHEFDRPAEERRSVTQYVARYDGAWWPLRGQVSFSRLDEAHLTRASQHSIRELDLDILHGLLEEAGWEAQPWARQSSDGDDPGGGWGTGSSRWRLGQASYRRRLLERDGTICAISGLQPSHILDAVHWTPFSQTGRHRLDRGLLLRRDLHALVDAYDMTIDVDSWTVRVNPALASYADITRWDGGPVRVNSELLDGAALREHQEASLELWR